MRMHLRALVALTILTAPAAAQVTKPSLRCAGGAVSAMLPGSLVEENARARSVRSGTTWSLTRATTDDAKARMRADSSPMPLRIAAVLPELIVSTNQSFPMPANDGPMWAGKGVNYSISGGIAVCGAHGRWGAILAPTYWYAENAPFDLVDNPQIIPPIRQDYSFWASPYHYSPRSLDSPRRLGATPLKRLDPGTLSIWYRAPRVEVGITTESEWWGPGQYNALLLSSQAAGFPRAYVRTAQPIRAKGELELRYFLGGLSYSPFFLAVPEDSARTLAGITVVWRPDFEKGLSLGVARLVAAPILGNGWLRHVLDPLTSVGKPNARSIEDPRLYPGRDQLFSTFINWRLPDDGTDLSLEWARAELPSSLRDFLDSPNHSQALTIGVQHAQPFRRKDWLIRVGGEYTQTTQSSSFRERPTGSWYTSRSVQGGFTQNGQVLGAMIGPGSVTQRANLDVSTPRHSLGLYVYRIKWDDDSFYRIPRPNGNGLCKHDVSLGIGLRASRLTQAGWLEANVSSQNRMNLYWQALGLCWANEELQVDKRNLAIEFRFHPRAR